MWNLEYDQHVILIRILLYFSSPKLVFSFPINIIKIEVCSAGYDNLIRLPAPGGSKFGWVFPLYIFERPTPQNNLKKKKKEKGEGGITKFCPKKYIGENMLRI